MSATVRDFKNNLVVSSMSPTLSSTMRHRILIGNEIRTIDIQHIVVIILKATSMTLAFENKSDSLQEKGFQRNIILGIDILSQYVRTLVVSFIGYTNPSNQCQNNHNMCAKNIKYRIKFHDFL